MPLKHIVYKHEKTTIMQDIPLDGSPLTLLARVRDLTSTQKRCAPNHSYGINGIKNITLTINIGSLGWYSKGRNITLTIMILFYCTLRIRALKHGS